MCAASNPLLRLTELAGDGACHVGIGHAVEGVGFAVAPGERVGLIAQSDCDKSVTASGIIGPPAWRPTPP